jgi:hypothetical protein
MTSIAEGYSCNIFITYRQKDNKGNRGVSEFADALKDELESTFKEVTSGYVIAGEKDELIMKHPLIQIYETISVPYFNSNIFGGIDKFGTGV